MCGGSGIYEHGRIRSACKDCGGSQICEHGRQRSICKECGGSQICAHDRQRSICKEYGASGICEHGRRISQCKESKACKSSKDMGVVVLPYTDTDSVFIVDAADSTVEETAVFLAIS